MGNILIDPNDSPIKPAYDQFLDKPMTRREAQMMFHKIGKNQTELFVALDTANIVVNFLCEKLGVSREELDAYAEKKKLEAIAWADAQRKTQEAPADAQPNSELSAVPLS
jgi:hypothetical protein